MAAGHSQFGVKLLLSYLINESPPPVKGKPGKAAKKVVLTSKQIAARYRALYEMIVANAFTPDQ